MKKLIIYICLLLPVVAIQSCKKEFSPGNNYDFSNPLPPYAALGSTAALDVELDPDLVTPSSADFTFVLRTALQQSVTLTYSVTGAITLSNQTAVIAKNITSVAVSIPVAAGFPVDPVTQTATATVTLTKAVAADGTILALGANNVAANQKMNIVITQL